MPDNIGPLICRSASILLHYKYPTAWPLGPFIKDVRIQEAVWCVCTDKGVEAMRIWWKGVIFRDFVRTYFMNEPIILRNESYRKTNLAETYGSHKPCAKLPVCNHLSHNIGYE